MKFYAHLILAIAALFLIAACSSDDDAASGLTATEGNGVAELTGVPSFSPDPVSIDSAVTVSVPVDSDTTHVRIDIGVYTSATSTLAIYGQSGLTAVTAGATNGVDVTVSSSMSAVTGTYVASVVTCSDGSCLLGSAGRWYVPGSTYTVLNLVDASLVSSGVAVPTFTVQ